MSGVGAHRPLQIASPSELPRRTGVRRVAPLARTRAHPRAPFLRENSWISKQRSETHGRRSRSPAGRCRAACTPVLVRTVSVEVVRCVPACKVYCLRGRILLCPDLRGPCPRIMFPRGSRIHPRPTEEPDRVQRTKSPRNPRNFPKFPKFCDGYPAKRVRRAIWSYWVNLWARVEFGQLVPIQCPVLCLRLSLCELLTLCRLGNGSRSAP